MQGYENVERWYLAYSNDVYKYLIYYTGIAEVEDMVQEVFLKAIKHINEYKEEAHPKTWLIAIARNIAIDTMRKKALKKLVPDHILAIIPSSSKNPEETLLLKEDMAELYSFVQRLKRPQRDVVILRGIMGMSVSEASEIIDRTPNSINVTFHRAIKALKKNITKHEKRGEVNESLDFRG